MGRIYRTWESQTIPRQSALKHPTRCGNSFWRIREYSQLVNYQRNGSLTCSTDVEALHRIVQDRSRWLHRTANCTRLYYGSLALPGEVAAVRQGMAEDFLTGFYSMRNISLSSSVRKQPPVRSTTFVTILKRSRARKTAHQLGLRELRQNVKELLRIRDDTLHRSTIAEHRKVRRLVPQRS